MRIYTIGHSNHKIGPFLSLLKRHDIQTLADVRSRPYSRFSPHFNKKALEKLLAGEKIHYLFLGAELGGRPSSPALYDPAGNLLAEKLVKSSFFEDGISILSQEVNSFRTAIMCAEEDPGKCHRRSLITPALERMDLEVVHIRKDGSLQSENELAGQDDSGGQLSLFKNKGKR